MSHKLDLLVPVWIIALLECRMVGGQLIRPVHVYEGMIKGVHDYFNNTCIILLHATPNPVTRQELKVADGLLALQMYLSAALHIRTAIMDFQMFQTRVGLSYYQIKRPLFVLLNDYEDLKEQFSHVSTWIAMNYPTWLVFLRNETEIDQFFNNTYVPFDCKLMVAHSVGGGNEGENIMEIYQVDKGKEMRKMRFGSWHPVTGFQGPTRGFFQRRNNLYGHNIRVASVNDPPVSIMRRNSNNEIIGMKGFFGEVVKLLQESMNCTISYRASNSWGVSLPNGTWTGTIGMLINNQVDLAATELMMTTDRLDAIEFTSPVYATKCRTYIKKPKSTAVKWTAYLAPFEWNIWNALCFLVVVASGTITFIRTAIDFASTCLKNSEGSPTKFTETTFMIFGAFCNQGMQQSLLDPVRLVHLGIHLTAVVVLAAYSAALISFLAVKTFVMPFTTMAGLLKDGTYRFGVIRNSADYSFFQNTSDKVLSVLFDDLLALEKNLPRNYLDGLHKVCEEKNYAFMTLDNMVALLQPKVSCTLEPLDIISQTTIAMGVRANSPYRGIINSNILLLRDSGILQRLLRTEWSIELSRHTSSWTSVELNDILPLILFMVGALFVSSCLLCFERLLYRNLTIKSKMRKNILRILTHRVRQHDTDGSMYDNVMNVTR